ncbi:MAG: tetratricopeptide repeat protein [Flavisolibacter sp.]|nr:tetratricopeptide repeat protein [Flavisolibacter sp.]
MKRTSLIIFFVFTIVTAYSQFLFNNDSLKQLLLTAKEDTNRVNILNALGFSYQWAYPDSALLYVTPGLQLAGKLQYKKGELAMMHTMGEALTQKGQFAQALQWQLQALELAKKLNDKVEIGNAHVWLGSTYYFSGNYDKALFHWRAKEMESATIASPKVVAGFFGETYFHLNQFDSALLYINKAYALDLRDETHWSVPYFYKAALLNRENKYDSAIQFYRLGIRNAAAATLDLINGYNGIAVSFRLNGQTDSAIYYAKKAITAVTTTSFITNILEGSQLLADIYKERKQPDSALKYQDIYLAAKDSLFSKEKVRQMQDIAFNEQLRQKQLEAEKEQYRNRMRVYALLIALVVFSVIAFLLWRHNQQRQKAFNQLQKQKEETDFQKAKAEQALEELKATQKQLIQSEKMASLGEVTAGIAHEIQNPLNFVNNFSEVSIELTEDLKQGPLQQITGPARNEAEELVDDLTQNLQKITLHGKRADAIVRGMLQHSRKSSGQKEWTDINALADEYFRLSYHGQRAKDKFFSATLQTDFDNSIGKVEVVPQEMGRVLLNLFNNAFYAVSEKKRQLNGDYEPVVAVTTRREKDKIEIRVKDNGIGIPQAIEDKIFQPFFTTKPTGEGTGLGLSLSYDIITKGDSGELKVEMQEGQGAEFIVSLLVQS